MYLIGCILSFIIIFTTFMITSHSDEIFYYKYYNMNLFDIIAICVLISFLSWILVTAIVIWWSVASLQELYKKKKIK